MADHVNRTRSHLTDARWHLRLARDEGQVPRDVAAVLLASLAEADDRLARYEDG